MQKITSRDNARLKLARKVRDGHEKSLIFIEGVRLTEEAVRSEIKISEVFVAESFRHNMRAAFLLEAFQKTDVSVSELPDSLFQTIADTKTSQGVIVIGEKPAAGKTDFEAKFSIEKRLPIVVFLSEVNNPSNLGAILRSAEAVDAAGVIVSKNSAEVFSPKSLRASMGAGFRLNIWTNAGLDEVLEWSKKHRLISTAADVNAGKSYSEIDWSKPRLLVFGSEGHGLRGEDFQKIEEGLIIPMANDVESLNLAVSCGIVLFEARRQTVLPEAKLNN